MLRRLISASVIAAAPATAQDIYGEFDFGAVYTESASAFFDEELQGSTVFARGTAGALWEDGRDTATRIEASSAYYAYVSGGRDDRWSNAVTAEHSRALSDTVTLELLATGATNVATLEDPSADQLLGRARMAFRPSQAHRFRVAGAYRHRYYGASIDGSSPYVEADYRYRLQANNYLDLGLRREWTDAERDTLDYKRTSVSAYYTHPVARGTQVRFGGIVRRWTYDARFVTDDPTERRRLTLWLPQVRLSHAFAENVDLDVDYTRVIRRSNDERFERNGNRVAATLSIDF